MSCNIFIITNLSNHKNVQFMKKFTNLNSYEAEPRKGVSWRAIFAGTITVLSVLLVLNLIGLSIGLGSIDPTEESNPLNGIGTGTIIWWILSNLIALFIGGFVAARVGVSFATNSGIVQGIMTWALYTIISAWLLTSAVGSIISGVGSVVGGVLTSAKDVVAEQVGPVVNKQLENVDISLDESKKEFYALLEDTDKENLDPDELEEKADNVTSDAEDEGQDAAKSPGQIDAEVEEIFGNAKNEFEGTFEALDKEALVNILMERTDMSESEAEETVDNYVASYENLREKSEEFLEKTKEQANETSEDVAEAVAGAAIYLAIALILGAIVAAAGGFLGVKNLRDDYEKNYLVTDDVDDDYSRRDRM